MSFDDHALIRRARVAEFRRMVGGSYQVRTQQNVVYFEDVAAVVWKNLSGRLDFAGLVEIVISEFDVDRATARADLADFLHDLLARGFAEVVTDE